MILRPYQERFIKNIAAKLRIHRKVEDENEVMIQKYGSVEAWYESGEGRLLNL